MEQYPVPQNVTTFQFRLIGDMTIKQFGYLAGGAVLAYIFYKLPLPFFFTWPAATFFALLGVGFAFVPIEERPMDIWVFSFFKSIYNPTQYVWQQTLRHTPPVNSPHPTPPTLEAAAPKLSPGQPTHQPTKASHVSSLEAIGRLFNPAPPTNKNAQSSAPAPHPRLIVNALPPRMWLLELFAQWFSSRPPRPHVARLPTTPPIPSVVGVHTEPMLQPDTVPPIKATMAVPLEQKLENLQKELATKSITEARVIELQKQLTELVAERSTMEKEMADLRKNLTHASQPSPLAHTMHPPTLQPAGLRPMPTTTLSTQPSVRLINQDAAVKAGLPRLTTFPNIVTGIIKDNQGGLLPGVLITIRDKDDVPLRALKTNKLGQFAASTQLPNGTYLVEIEDPRERFVFDRVQVTLGGRVAPALEIIAKSQKEITRQQLAQEIFGKPNI